MGSVNMINKKKRFSQFSKKVLEDSGWYEGRCVRDLFDKWMSDPDIKNKFTIFPIAEKVLLEFGGIHIDQHGPGISCARSPFEIDPTLCIGEDDRFDEFGEEIKSRLFPLGEAVGGHLFLAIDESGRVFLLMQEIMFEANSFDEALENLIQGINM